MTTMYKHVVDTTQSRVKKRNETSVIGREERKKNRTEYDIFTSC